MAWNVFRFCTALRGLGSIMILLVLSIVGVTYYAVVVYNYGPALFAGGASTLLALAVLLLFHFLLVMLLWSYFSVVFTDPGSVPPNWNLDFDEERGETAPLSGLDFNSQVNSQQSIAHNDIGHPRARYCRKCNQLKPPRCHHCSFYTFLETTLVTLSLLPHFIAFFSDIDIPGSPAALATTFLTFVLNLAFSLSVLGFMIMHAYEKKTTPRWIYDLGRKRNFIQVFGNDKRYWFIPAYSEEDLRRMPVLQGLDYPVRTDLDGQEL
uniref:Palmitoyltransferase n=1 Tax=Oryza punctata TaxID=4537 RepID=A0A0E0KKD7_ORYPU